MHEQRICIVGAGYVGMRLCKALLDQGHHVLVVTRSASTRLKSLQACKRLDIIEWDLTQPACESDLVGEPISHVFYLVHSMTGNYSNFGEKEILCVKNLAPFLKKRQAKHVVYLGALCSETQSESRHFTSRCATKNALKNLLSPIKITALNASIILGSGSASFEIIRDLVKKLPIMVAPKWIHQKCQPVAVADVLQALIYLIQKEEIQGSDYDLCGDQVLSFYELMHLAAKQEKKHPLIFSVPVLTPYLSALWLYFVTSVDFSLARALIESMRFPSIAKGESILKKLDLTPLTMQKALERAVEKEASDQVLSSWSDSLPLCKNSSCLTSAQKKERERLCSYRCEKEITWDQFPHCAQRIWEIGGKNGWYAYDGLWKLRGLIDLLLGGKGLNRGRRSQKELYPGDFLDFWRVIEAKKVIDESAPEKQELHLLLFAQMLLPGKAWLEFQVTPKQSTNNMLFVITAHFLPASSKLIGAFGRLYWYSTYPLHVLLFRKLLKRCLRRVDS